MRGERQRLGVIQADALELFLQEPLGLTVERLQLLLAGGEAGDLATSERVLPSSSTVASGEAGGWQSTPTTLPLVRKVLRMLHEVLSCDKSSIGP